MPSEALSSQEMPIPPQLSRVVGEAALRELKQTPFKRIDPASVDLETIKLFKPYEDMGDVLSVRTRAITASLVKETFQKIPVGITADQRAAERAQRRVDSVRIIFKTVGVLPKDEIQDDVFAELYRKKEVATSSIDKDLLSNWYDKFESHPALQTLDTIAATAGMRDDLVYMRRTTLALLAEHSL